MGNAQSTSSSDIAYDLGSENNNLGANEIGASQVPNVAAQSSVDRNSHLFDEAAVARAKGRPVVERMDSVDLDSGSGSDTGATSVASPDPGAEMRFQVDKTAPASPVGTLEATVANALTTGGALQPLTTGGALQLFSQVSRVERPKSLHDKLSDSNSLSCSLLAPARSLQRPSSEQQLQQPEQLWRRRLNTGMGATTTSAGVFLSEDGEWHACECLSPHSTTSVLSSTETADTFVAGALSAGSAGFSYGSMSGSDFGDTALDSRHTLSERSGSSARSPLSLHTASDGALDPQVGGTDICESPTEELKIFWRNQQALLAQKLRTGRITRAEHDQMMSVIKRDEQYQMSESERRQEHRGLERQRQQLAQQSAQAKTQQQLQQHQSCPQQPESCAHCGAPMYGGHRCWTSQRRQHVCASGSSTSLSDDVSSDDKNGDNCISSDSGSFDDSSDSASDSSEGDETSKYTDDEAIGNASSDGGSALNVRCASCRQQCMPHSPPPPPPPSPPLSPAASLCRSPPDAWSGKKRGWNRWRKTLQVKQARLATSPASSSSPIPARELGSRNTPVTESVDAFPRRSRTASDVGPDLLAQSKKGCTGKNVKDRNAAHCNTPSLDKFAQVRTERAKSEPAPSVRLPRFTSQLDGGGACGHVRPAALGVSASVAFSASVQDHRHSREAQMTWPPRAPRIATFCDSAHWFAGMDPMLADVGAPDKFACSAAEATIQRFNPSDTNKFKACDKAETAFTEVSPRLGDDVLSLARFAIEAQREARAARRESRRKKHRRHTRSKRRQHNDRHRERDILPMASVLEARSETQKRRHKNRNSRRSRCASSGAIYAAAATTSPIDETNFSASLPIHFSPKTADSQRRLGTLPHKQKCEGAATATTYPKPVHRIGVLHKQRRWMRLIGARWPERLFHLDGVLLWYSYPMESGSFVEVETASDQCGDCTVNDSESNGDVVVSNSFQSASAPPMWRAKRHRGRTSQRYVITPQSSVEPAIVEGTQCFKIRAQPRKPLADGSRKNAPGVARGTMDEGNAAPVELETLVLHPPNDSSTEFYGWIAAIQGSIKLAKYQAWFIEAVRNAVATARAAEGTSSGTDKFVIQRVLRFLEDTPSFKSFGLQTKCSSTQQQLEHIIKIMLRRHDALARSTCATSRLRLLPSSPARLLSSPAGETCDDDSAIEAAQNTHLMPNISRCLAAGQSGVAVPPSAAVDIDECDTMLIPLCNRLFSHASWDRSASQLRPATPKELSGTAGRHGSHGSDRGRPVSATAAKPASARTGSHFRTASAELWERGAHGRSEILTPTLAHDAQMRDTPTPPIPIPPPSPPSSNSVQDLIPST